MSLENLTTVNKYLTEKVTSNVVQQTINNPGNSGTNTTSNAWQISNVTTNTYDLVDENGNPKTYSSPPIVRAKWSNDNGATWYEVATGIPYSFNLNGSGSGGTFTQRTPNNSAACTVGVSTSQIQIRTANGLHGNVALNTGTLQYTWTGTPQTFLVKYVTLEPTPDNIVVSSKNTIPINKVLKTGTANFSGSVPTVATFQQLIDIDYEPEFFSIEFDVIGHDYDPSISYGIPNDTYTHSNGIGYTFITSGADSNSIFMSGGIVSGDSPKFLLTAFVTNGSTATTTTNFSVRYRIIDLGVKQVINNSDMSKLALSSVGNSPSREFSINTSTGGSANTSSNYANSFGGYPFVDFYFDCANDGFYWRNGYRQDAIAFYSPSFGSDTSPKALMYTSPSNISAFWLSGWDSSTASSISPSGRVLRYIDYGDYTA